MTEEEALSVDLCAATDEGGKKEREGGEREDRSHKVSELE